MTSNLEQDTRPEGITDLERSAVAIMGNDAPENWLMEWREAAGGKVMCVDLADMDDGGIFVASAWLAPIDLTPEALASALRMSVYLTTGQIKVQDGAIVSP